MSRGAPPLSAERVPADLAALAASAAASATSWTEALIRGRGRFGITRVGAIAGLDRIGIPVVQAVRPLALTNAVSQGKGLTWMQAAISALMEAIEGHAAETIPPARVREAPARALGPDVAGLYRGWLTDDAPTDWESLPLAWIDGWDLFSERVVPVPLALVDTIYTLPSPHPRLFPRATTGLAGGRCLAQALNHAGLEILERDAVAGAHRIDGFFQRFRTRPEPAGEALAGLLARIAAAGLLAGFWQAPAAHPLPVFWCHLLERADAPELVPLPSEGFACGFTQEDAMLRALLEACQARATAIAGAREDITRRHYPSAHDRRAIAEWREELLAPRAWRLPDPARAAEPDAAARPGIVLDALRRAGARAAIVVPLFADEEAEIHVARLVAPPLRLDPRA